MIRLISVPYHLGRRDVGMGAGPGRLLSAGAMQVLASGGRHAAVVEVELPVAFEHEIGAHFALQRALAEQVQRTVAAGDFPCIVGGNCSNVLGIVAGLGLEDRSGVVWFDAHGDVNTPETTTSGFLDGMPVAVLTGRCWSPLASSIPGFAAVPDTHVLLAGVRALDDDERRLVDSSGIGLVDPGELANGEAFAARLSTLAQEVDSVHVHIDLDVIDTLDGHANEFAAAGGPSLDVLGAAVRAVGRHCRVNSVSLTSYNPTVDVDGRALDSGLRLLSALAELAPPGG